MDDKLLSLNVMTGSFEEFDIMGIMTKKHFWQKLKSDSRYRNRWVVGFSLGFNLLFIVTQFLDSILTGTFWASAIGIYYTAIILAKILLLNGMKNRVDPERERKLVLATGVILLALYALLGGSTVQLVQQNPETAHSYPGAVITVAFTLYQIVSAAVSIHRYRKENDLVLTALKIVNLMAAIVAIVMAQTTVTMLLTSNSIIIQWITGVVGTLSSVGIALASVVLIRMGLRGKVVRK